MRTASFQSLIWLALAASSMGCASRHPPPPEFSSAERLVCKTEKQTGSHMVRRVCHTAGEWEAMERESVEAMRRVTSRGSSCATPTCD